MALRLGKLISDQDGDDHIRKDAFFTPPAKLMEKKKSCLFEWTERNAILEEIFYSYDKYVSA